MRFYTLMTDPFNGMLEPKKRFGIFRFTTFFLNNENDFEKPELILLQIPIKIIVSTIAAAGKHPGDVEASFGSNVFKN